MPDFKAVLGFVLCLLALYASVQANVVVDQQLIPPNPPPFSAGIWNRGPSQPLPILSSAQTFTVGVNGTLEQVDVQVQNKNASQPLTMRILGTTADGTPDSTQMLAIMSLPASAITTLNTAFRSFVFPQDQWLPVHQGEVLAIALSEDTPDTSGIFGWWGSETATYSGGGAYQDTDNRNLWQLDYPGNADQSGFRTWVDTPEPSLIVPITLVGLLIRRRRSHGAYGPIPK